MPRRHRRPLASSCPERGGERPPVRPGLRESSPSLPSHPAPDWRPDARLQNVDPPLPGSGRRRGKHNRHPPAKIESLSTPNRDLRRVGTPPGDRLRERTRGFPAAYPLYARPLPSVHGPRSRPSRGGSSVRQAFLGGSGAERRAGVRWGCSVMSIICSTSVSWRVPGLVQELLEARRDEKLSGTFSTIWDGGTVHGL